MTDRRAAALLVGAAMLTSLLACTETTPAEQPGSPPTGAAKPVVSVVPTSSRDDGGPLVLPLGAVRNLPWAASDVLPAVPRRIRPPRRAASVLDEPVMSASVALEVDGRVWVLSTGGDWRTVPLAGARTTMLAISPGGTRLAVANHARVASGIVLYDLVRGERRRVPPPPGFSSWDFHRLRWADESRLHVEDLPDPGRAYDGAPVPGSPVDSWRITAATGRTVSYDPRSRDPAWIQAADDSGHVAGVRRRARTTVVVADRASSVVLDRLVVEEHGVLDRGLSVLALRPDGTVLLRATESSATGLFRIVAWHPGRRTLEAVAATEVLADVVFAEDVLAGTVPVGEGPWDPRDVDELPAAPADAVPALPAAVLPPATAPALSSAPVPAAVAVVVRGSTAFLLTPEGEWRSVRLATDDPHVTLSPLGTRLLVTSRASRGVVTVHDLGTAARLRIDPPSEGGTGWWWLDEETLLAEARREAVVVEIDSQEQRQVPYPRRSVSAVSDQGHVLEAPHHPQRRSKLTDWAGGQPRRIPLRDVGWLQSMDANADVVVGTTYDARPFSVVVIDRSTGDLVDDLRLVDHDANYSNWGLRVLTVQDDGTVLLRVAAIGRDRHGFRVVAWDPGSGSLRSSSLVDVPIRWSVGFAEGLLR